VRQAACFLAHYALAGWILFIGYVLLWDYGLINPPLLLGIGLLILLLCVVGGQISHGKVLCVRCVKAIPVNGAEMAEKRARSLKLFHLTTKIILSVLVVVALIALSQPWLLLWWVLLSFLEMRHRRVRLWCPACKGGEDHDSDVNPEVPHSTGTK